MLARISLCCIVYRYVYFLLLSCTFQDGCISVVFRPLYLIYHLSFHSSTLSVFFVTIPWPTCYTLLTCSRICALLTARRKEKSMEIVQICGIHPSHSAHHVGGRYMGQFTPEALLTFVVTIPSIWGTSLTVRGRQVAAWTRGGSPWAVQFKKEQRSRVEDDQPCLAM